jgi:hypothetical protein
MAEPFLHHFRRQLQLAFAGNSDRTLGLPVQLAFIVQLALAAGGHHWNGGNLRRGRLPDRAARRPGLGAR